MGLLMRDGAETHTDHTGVGECVTVKSDSLSHPAERTIRGLDSAILQIKSYFDLTILNLN